MSTEFYAFVVKQCQEGEYPCVPDINCPVVSIKFLVKKWLLLDSESAVSEWGNRTEKMGLVACTIGKQRCIRLSDWSKVVLEEKGHKKALRKKPAPAWDKSRSRWRARVLMDDGKYKTSYHKTKTEARAAIDTIWSRRSRGINSKMLTFQQLIDIWMQHGTEIANWRPKTIDDYQVTIARMGDLSSIPVDFIRREDCEQCIHSQPTQDTKRRVRLTLITIMRWAVRKEYTVNNPAELTDPIPRDRVLAEVLDLDEVLRALSALPRLHDPLRFMFLMALRPGEVFALHWDDYSKHKRTLNVRRKVNEVRGKQNVGPPKTRSSIRVLPLSQAAIDIIESQPRRGKILFASTSKKATYTRRTVYERAWKQGLEAAGIDHCRLYTLRHSSATIMLNNGVPLSVVSRSLGHSSITTTLSFYSHLMRGELSAVADFWDTTVNNLSHNMAHPSD